jgi:hypothetical protein
MSMRLLPVLCILAACGTRSPGPTLPVPAVEVGRLALAARAVDRTGSVQPVAVAITNGRDRPVALDTRQIYALTADDLRLAPLPPGEAARAAGGHQLPGSVKGGVFGAATGGAVGAVGGVISGAIQGGMGLAVGVGSAVGATIGAIYGVLGGRGGRQPDVAGFTDRALASTSLGPGLSATGYVYYPTGRLVSLELLVPSGSAEAPERVTTPIEPAP